MRIHGGGVLFFSVWHCFLKFSYQSLITPFTTPLSVFAPFVIGDQCLLAYCSTVSSQRIMEAIILIGISVSVCYSLTELYRSLDRASLSMPTLITLWDCFSFCALSLSSFVGTAFSATQSPVPCTCGQFIMCLSYLQRQCASVDPIDMCYTWYAISTFSCSYKGSSCITILLMHSFPQMISTILCDHSMELYKDKA